MGLIQMAWIETKKEMPKNGLPVLVCGVNSYNKTRRMRACYIPDNYIESDGEDFYNEDKDVYYWPKGWYEWNEHEETHWMIDFEITHWMQFPEPPNKNIITK